ncbi:MAG: peptidase U32 family protein [Opitutia bacterium]
MPLGLWLAPAVPAADVASLRKPEVLAPAGGWDCVRAAVENGADAVFFGVGRFNARVRAANFEEADLPELMRFLHGRGARGYVTFNTLIFPEELAEAARTLRTIVAAGVDAAIVQDAGICRLIRRVSPDFPIHASTQMTVTSGAGVAFARELGASLAVLGREVSLPEIRGIREEQSAKGLPLDLEVFVHGALCVAYSGQCLTSESLGGRSANRGECAQACRLPYELVVDGRPVDLGDRAYLLSPQDLAGVEAVPDLIRAGVRSLKIEGRLKSPEYVAAITRAYRRAVDAAWEALAKGADADAAAAQVRREEDYAMQMTFSRGLHTGWLRGIDNQRLVHARFGTKRGAFLGEVAEVGSNGVLMRLKGPLKPGDGVVFDQGKPAEREQGGFVHGVEPGRGGMTFVRFGRADVDWSLVSPGALLWKTKDPELERRLRDSWDRERPNHRRPVFLRAAGRVGLPLRVELRDADGHVAVRESAVPCAAAEKRPMDVALLREQFGRLGETALELRDVEADLQGALIVPVSELNRMRRELADDLAEQRARPPRWTLLPYDPKAVQVEASAPPAVGPAEIVAVIREPAQLEPVLEWGAKFVYAEFEDPKKFRAAMARVKEFREARGTAVEFWAMGPRLRKQGEDRVTEIVLSCGADGYLARNHEDLRAFAAAGVRRRGDFSLNVANGLTAEWLMSRHGLEGLTASYDLDAGQLAALLRSAPPAWFEVTLHQHMPMFHMEHCVFCAFLSKGKDYRDCGRPCEKHRVTLRDRVGAEHLLRADAGCRNTLYNSRAQTGAEYAGQLTALGVRRFRVEFVDEDPATVTRTLAKYRALLDGDLDGTALWNDLKVLNQLGVTRGTLRVRP